MLAHVCVLCGRVGVFAAAHSTPTVGTVEPSVGDNHLLEKKTDF